MLTEIHERAVVCLRLSQLIDEHRATQRLRSAKKPDNSSPTRALSLGGNGIPLSSHVARHFADMEGTDHMQMLVVGKEICGASAFK